MKRLWYFAQNILGVIFRHPITGTSVIPLLPDGRIVLVKRRDNGRWALPGGMVNWGEDIPTAMQRELLEETGLKLVKISRLVGVYSSPERDPRVHSICIAVAAEVSGEMQTEDPNEITDVQAFTLNALPLGNLAHDHDRQLQDYLKNLTTLA
jgi:ADP-ribose pyrophosphatase YjhB (NUDIX family)